MEPWPWARVEIGRVSSSGFCSAPQTQSAGIKILGTSNRSQGQRPLPPMTLSGLRRGAAPRIERAAQAEIGARLRAAYGELMGEPVPEHLADLVRRLERGNPGRAATRDGKDKR